MWAFIVTDLEGDPPRMLDEPMSDADAQGVRAVAVLFGPDRIVGTGFSRMSFDVRDSQGLDPPDVDDLLASGEADEALDRVVDYLESWAESPPVDGEAPPVDGVEAPSSVPVP